MFLKTRTSTYYTVKSGQTKVASLDKKIEYLHRPSVSGAKLYPDFHMF